MTTVMASTMRIRTVCERHTETLGEGGLSRRGWILLLVVFSCLVISTGRSHARPGSSPFRPDMKALGMGGAFVAGGDNANALVYNPALLGRAQFGLVIPSLRFRLDNDFLEVANFAVDHRDDFALYDSLYTDPLDSSSTQALSDFLDAMTPYEDRWGKTRFAPMISFTFKNFGIGVYNTTDIWIKVDKGIYNPRVYGQAVSDLVFLTGYAHPLREELTVGVTGKYISRRRSGLVRIATSDLGGTNEILKPAYDRLRVDERGVGLDLGILYAARPRLDLGVVLQEAFGQIGGENMPRNLKVGVAYRCGTIPWLPLKDGVVAADVEDLLFTSGDSVFKRVHFGGAMTLSVFDVRAGFNQGYPSVGLSLNLFIFKINYVYYGEESGRLPGEDADWLHALELAVGW